MAPGGRGDPGPSAPRPVAVGFRSRADAASPFTPSTRPGESASTRSSQVASFQPCGLLSTAARESRGRRSTVHMVDGGTTASSGSNCGTT